MRAHGGAVYAAHVGPIHSPVSGRTDHLPIHVISGSYVIPADIISGMGQGNTMAGFKLAKDMFGQKFYGQHGTGSSTPYSSSGNPYGVSSPHAHRRGGSEGREWDENKLVPIIAAGGEFVMHPMDVAAKGHGSLDDGHEVMDHFVRNYRKHLIKTLTKLPGPKRD